MPGGVKAINTPTRQTTTTPSRRTKESPAKPTVISVTATRKLPFQEKPELGHKHRRSLENGLTRAVIPMPRAGQVEKNGLEITSQRILNEQLVRLTALLLRSQATKTAHDSAAVRDHAYQRAHEVVDDELAQIITKLVGMQGPSPMHRVVALSQLSTSVAKDIEKAIFTDDRAYLANFANEQRVRREEAAATHAAFAHELATKEQTLAAVSSDKAELEKASLALSRKCQALEKELEKAMRNQAQTHQNAVELRMQGLDFKARVDNRCARILASIQSRMGFIPAGIQKQILYLKVLKAPGDPQYDEVRMHTHMRATKRRFDPGDEKRHKGLGAGSFGPRPSTVPMPGVWAQRAANEELPSSFAEGGRLARYQQLQQLQQLQQQQRSSGSSPIDDEWASTRAAGSGVSQDSSDAELMPPTRPPKTQEDWVRWALNAGGQAHGLGKQSASSVDDIMDHVSSNAATVGGAGSATSSDHYYAGDDDEDQENERDSDSEEEEEYDDSIDDDDDEDEDPTPVSGAKRGGYGEIVGIAFGGGGSRVTRPTDYLWKGEGGSLLG